jgi:signal transduction histidine kinase
VIRSIRDLARRANPQVIPLDINEVIDEALALVKQEALSHRVSVQLQLAPALPLVRGDRIQLQQVIINLAINGVQAMAPVTDRARVLTIRTEQREPDKVLVAVQDVGIGMEPEGLDRLFSAFYTTKPDGMGMGLSICRSIIEAHGGRVWTSPNIDSGMTFQFTVSAYRSVAVSKGGLSRESRSQIDCDGAFLAEVPSCVDPGHKLRCALGFPPGRAAARQRLRSESM